MDHGRNERHAGNGRIPDLTERPGPAGPDTCPPALHGPECTSLPPATRETDDPRMPHPDSVRMHICLVTETFTPEINGVALTLRTLAHALHGLGHEVSLVRPRQPQASGAPSGFDELLVPGAPLPRYPGLRFGMPVVGRLRRHWRRRRPDAIYVATEGPLGWAAVRAARTLHIPVATGFHTRFDSYFSHYGLPFLAPLAFAWLRRFHNHGGMTLVPTAQLRDFLSGQGFANVQVLRRAVDTRRFDPARRDPALRHSWQLDDDGLAVLYSGRMAPEKNLDLAVRAFRAMATVHPRARFILVGDGPARGAMERAHPDLHFAGLRLDEDLARHYASADVFLFPSLTETFGNVTLEAMASGLATVAFDYGAAREYIRDTSRGSLVPCGDERAFIAAAIELARDAELRRNLGKAARASLLGEDAEGLARRFVALLHTLAGCRRAA